MTLQRRIIAAAVQRLRDYIAAGGRPYLSPNGNLAISSLVPGQRRRGSADDQAMRERAADLFHRAAAHAEARAIIVRAIAAIGVRQPLGHIIVRTA